MDHSHYTYSAIPKRTPLPLAPALNVFAVLYLEHWDFEAPEGSVRDPRFVGEFGGLQTPTTGVGHNANIDCELAFSESSEALLEAGIQPVVAANSLVLPRVPKVLETLKESKAEWVAHGMAATRLMHSNMSLDEQREHIATSLNALQTYTGQSSKGWLSQDWGTTRRLLTCWLMRVFVTPSIGATTISPTGCPLAPLNNACWRCPCPVNGMMCKANGSGPLKRPSMPAQIFQAAQQMQSECQTLGRSAVMGLGLHPSGLGHAKPHSIFKRLAQAIEKC
jgi:hypothetical protein